VLSQRPGLSNAELARAVFVTRQSMNLVLRGLQDRGLVTRPTTAPQGRALPSTLTAAGQDRLRGDGGVVRAVRDRMLEPFPAAEQERLLWDLAACADALAE